jgi:hypothetical protein
MIPLLFAFVRDRDFTFAEDSQFVILDDSLDVSGQVREHTYITQKDIRRIPLTPLHVVTSANLFRQKMDIKNRFSIRVKGKHWGCES